MTTSITCSWCHTINGRDAVWCKKCGHSVWAPRTDCECRSCLGVLFMEPAPKTKTKTKTKTKPRKQP